jgi:iron complex outermembrane receptor protein
MGQQTPCQLPANVGKADVKGVELETSMILGGGFTADIAASWLDFKYTETNFATTNIPTSFVTPFTPEKKAAVGMQWENEFAGGNTLVIRGDYAYQSQMYGDAFNNPFNRIPSSAFGNVRLTWRGVDNQWETSLEVLNVTDKLYYLATNDYSASAGSSSYAPALPRTWALTIKRKFD